ncbi:MULTISPECIES: tetratricopeptide repeat protein [unclassified Microcoleus]|uniref:tetratricopeptide repeat protein n=1 Tax=unclassified Microcoleus TaxID=2642155 RepID=UPI002FD45F73
MEATKTAVDYLDEGDRLVESGNLEEAIAAYRRAIELNPDHSWSHHNVGEALGKLGQFEEAIASYRRAIELNPDFSWSYHHLGDALERRQQWEEAVVVFRKAIELNADHFGSYVGLGKSLEKLGQLDEAIAAYRRASEINPEADWIQYRLGEVLQQRTQLDLDGAIASYRRAIELNPDDVPSYRKLLEIRPDNLDIWLQLAKALIKIEQWAEASVCYRRITELNPDDVQACQRLGELLLQQEDFEGAIDIFRHSLKQNPNSDEFYYNLGEALAAQGNATEASLCYYKAFKINPNNMQANQKRPRIYDCFPFFNELDILKIRIEELKDVVDKFILVEATKTHSGQPKPLYYKDFIHEFAEYQDRIIHYVVDDMPEVQNNDRWPLENYQRDCIGFALMELECQDEDVILVSDADEIPRKNKINEAIELLSNNDFVIFTHDLYAHNLDNLRSEWWCGTVACKYKNLKQRTVTQVRRSDAGNWAADSKAGYINESRNFGHPYIVKGGWSFSWFGTPISNRYKLQSFAHAEVDDSEARGLNKLKYDVCRPTLEFESSGEYYFDVRDIEGKDVPEFLSNNVLKYRHFLQPRPTEMMAKFGGEFQQAKQAETILKNLRNEAIKVKEDIEKGIQNLLKVCEILAEKGELVEAIAQWRRLVELYPEFTSKKCFLSNLDGIKTWRINPEDYTLISGLLIPTQTGNQLVSQTGNHGQVCYGPYITLPAGLYRIRLDLESSDYTGSQVSNEGQYWFKFDVALNKAVVIYQEDVYFKNQKNHEFFVDFSSAKDLEIRFWAAGLFFAINFIELTLIYQTDLQKTQVYEDIWKELNQLEYYQYDRPDYLTESNPEVALQYFQLTSRYRVVTMQLLTEDDKNYLEKIGLSLANLEVIAQDNFALEESYINNFGDHLKKPIVPNINLALPYQQVLVETGYIYSVCPFSGKILRSNQSFVINHQENSQPQRGHDLQGFCYRFVGKEVFYLMVGCPMGEKLLLYFPKIDMIINLSAHLAGFARAVESMNKLKAYMVSSWKNVKFYIATTEKKKVVDVIGLGFNMAHYLWQDLTAMDVLHENGILHKLDKILVGPGDYFSCQESFPEIPADKFIEVEDVSDVFKKVIENNYVALRVNSIFIKEQLIERIRQTALHKCSIDFLTNLKKVKQHHPVLGVQVRASGRVWVSQVTGIANIINKLFLDYPNLAVVFDGWSVTGKEDSSNLCWSTISMEKEVMNKIIALINPNIPTHSAIASTFFETSAWWSEAIDIHISPIGSGLTYGSWIANKPGVVHGPIAIYWNKSLFAQSVHRENLLPQVFILEEYIIDKGNGSYDCDWTVMYDEVIKILKQIDTNLHTES